MFAKRLLVFLLVMGLVVVVAGCGGKKAVEETPSDIDAPPVVEPPVEEEPVVQEEPKEVPMPVLDDVFFAFDKYSLTEESKRSLEQNAKELKRASGATIVIEGHCDERGTKAYNLSLGEKRANAAKEYLVALGVPGSRVAIISYGKEQPFDPGHDETAWAKNRRAHFVIKK
ncbi:MAG: peptidoglycan-associated lipoprotein Pal [Candidatus Krumholzibacteria bacterium]|nr:peptidoglycan-associated lipoprotein Pal [Candidatus Krumholzibacteria bacterium]